MINKFKYIFGSKSKAQEIVLLLNDVKPVVRQGFYDNEIIGVEKFCKDNNLFHVTSKFKVLLVDNGDYSNKGIRVKGDDKRAGMRFVYISKDEQQTWLAAYHELMRNDKELGLLLGYPVCCINYFRQSFNAENVNPMHAPTNPYTNLAKRENDLVLLSHFPCSNDCEMSVELAKKYLDVIADVDSSRAMELMEGLR